MRLVIIETTLFFVILLGLGMLWTSVRLARHSGPYNWTSPRDRTEGTVFGIIFGLLSVGVILLGMIGAISAPSW